MTDQSSATDATNTTESIAPVSDQTTQDDTLLGGVDQTSNTDQTKDAQSSAETDAAAKEAKPDDAPQGAPETYDDFTMPEGVEIDPETTGELKVLAKDFNLSQDQAQKLADLGVTMSQKWNAALQDHVNATSDAWAESAKSDKDIGGDKLPENLGLAKATLEQFGTSSLRELLNTSRLGNHPEVIRLLSAVGRAMSNDNRITTGSLPTGPVSLANKLYPS